MKVCNRCKKNKPLSAYYNKKDSKDGKATICKECRKVQDKAYYQKNRELKIAYAKQWEKDNPEKRREIARRHYLKNQEYYQKKDQEWFQKNKARLRPIRAKYQRERKKKDPHYKLAFTVREKTWHAITKDWKSSSSLELLGCSIEELKVHIESLFQTGMTWDNWSHDGWHLDHIIPIASFDLSKEEEQRKCFHYTNLQPLWAEDNLSKQDKVLEEFIPDDHWHFTTKGEYSE